MYILKKPKNVRRENSVKMGAKILPPPCGGPFYAAASFANCVSTAWTPFSRAAGVGQSRAMTIF